MLVGMGLVYYIMDASRTESWKADVTAVVAGSIGAKAVDTMQRLAGGKHFNE